MPNLQGADTQPVCIPHTNRHSPWSQLHNGLVAHSTLGAHAQSLQSASGAVKLA